MPQFVGAPNIFKFPLTRLLYRIDIYCLSRRRGWLMLWQLALAATPFGGSQISPWDSIRTFACLVVAVAFRSATQVAVNDSY